MLKNNIELDVKVKCIRTSIPGSAESKLRSKDVHECRIQDGR